MGGKLTKGTGNTAFLNQVIRGNYGTTTSSSSSCCILMKMTGSTMNWVQTVENIGSSNIYCYSNPVTSVDGTKVFAAGKTQLVMLDASTGTQIASKTITGADYIKGLAVRGTNLFVLGESNGGEATVSVDSASVAKASATVGTWAWVIKLTTTATGMAGAIATWIGSDEYSTKVKSIQPAYNVSGYPEALVVAAKVHGTKITRPRSRAASGTTATLLAIKTLHLSSLQLASSCRRGADEAFEALRFLAAGLFARITVLTSF